MKIGLFGDSFADNTGCDIWWKDLHCHGHTVQSFGRPGSSLSFSAGLLWNHANQFDYLIWCVTSVNRVSFYFDDQDYHITNSFDGEINDSPVGQLKKISQQYLGEVFDTHGHEVMGTFAVHGALQVFSNLMIIPCFENPVYFMKEPGFNLFQLSNQETAHYFPKQDVHSIHSRYIDLRPGHMTEQTGRILARQVATAIDQGVKIFNSDYNDFPAPIEPLDRVFQPR